MITCPHCKHEFIYEPMSRGGKVKGPCKARSSEQARAAINARWDRVRKEKKAAAKAAAALK